MTLPPGLCRPKWLMEGKWKRISTMARGGTKGANYINFCPAPHSVVSQWQMDKRRLRLYIRGKKVKAQLIASTFSVI